MNCEEKFRCGLKNYIQSNQIRQTALADRTGIQKQNFHMLLNSSCRIYSDEVASICEATGLTFREILAFSCQAGEPEKGSVC
jgi:DNA-binding Xre family transcriptional regulator